MKVLMKINNGRNIPCSRNSLASSVIDSAASIEFMCDGNNIEKIAQTSMKREIENTFDSMFDCDKNSLFT